MLDKFGGTSTIDASIMVFGLLKFCVSTMRMPYKTLGGLAWGKRVGPRQGEAQQSLNIKHYPLCTGAARLRTAQPV
jgi:hypothetical protein